MTFPWRTALFISVGLNLILVSAIVGAFLSGARLQQPSAQVSESPQIGERLAGQRAFMAALPPETRVRLRRELARDLIAMRAERSAAFSARAALYEAARAEPYDAARVRAAFAEVRQADAVLLEGFHSSLSEALGRLDAEDRAAALEALSRRQTAAPEDVAPPGPGMQRPPLTPEQRQERREQFRERLRERREERRQQAP